MGCGYTDAGGSASLGRLVTGKDSPATRSCGRTNAVGECNQTAHTSYIFSGNREYPTTFWRRESTSLEEWRGRLRPRGETRGEQLAVSWDRKSAMCLLFINSVEETLAEPGPETLARNCAAG